MSNPNARRWQEAARTWVERGALSLFGDAWLDAAASRAARQLDQVNEQLVMIEESLAAVERLHVQGHERKALQKKATERIRRRELLDKRRAVLERVSRLSRGRHPEPLRRWRVGCVARLDRAPIALSEMTDLQWPLRGPPSLRRALDAYVARLRAIAAEAEVSVVRTKARKALLESAEDTSEASEARAELKNARSAMVPLVARGLEAEMELCYAIRAARRETLAPLSLTPPADGTADDVVRVPERLWVRLITTSSRFDAEADRKASQLVESWPAWLSDLHTSGAPEPEATLQMFAIPPDRLQ